MDRSTADDAEAVSIGSIYHALTVLVLGIATLLACLLPAARAIQINPTSVVNE